MSNTNTTIQHWLKRCLAPALRRGRSFARDDRGVTAIEFSILALPFFTLIFAIIETAMVFFGAQVLDSAVEDASRLIRTGQAQAANYTISDFRNLVCASTFNLIDCSKILIKVSVVTDFTTAAAPATAPTATCTPAGVCTWSTANSYAPGTGRQVVRVQAYYRWPLIVVLPGFNLKNQSDNYRLFAAVRVFRNEPFS